MKKLVIQVARNNGSAGSANITFDTRETGKAWRTRRFFAPTTSVPVNDDMHGLVLPPLTDYRVRIRDVSDSNTIITGTLDYYTAEI